MNKAFVLALVLLFSAAAYAFSGSGGTYDLTLGHEDGFAGNASGGTYETDFVSGEAPTGQWASGSLTAEVGVFFIGRTPATVLITAPSAGYSTSSTSITMTYSGIPGDSTISRYWVRLDSDEWIDNSLNTSYTFSNLTASNHNFSVKATDFYDLNSADSNVSVTVTASATVSNAGIGTTCSQYNNSQVCSLAQYCTGSMISASDTDRCCLGECIQRFTEKKQTSFAQFAAFGGAISSTAMNEVIDDTRLEGKRLALPDEIIISRTINSNVVLDNDNPYSVDINVTVYVRNVSGKNYSNVSVIESVPKKLAENVSLISFQEPPRILLMDPVVEWIIMELEAGQEKEFHYNLSKVSDESILGDLRGFFAGMPTPTALIVASETDLCSGITCNDGNPCTQDYCVKGSCYNSSREGLYCGPSKVCHEQQCIDESTFKTEQKSGEEKQIIIVPSDQNLAYLAIVLSLVAIVIGLLFFILKRKDEKISQDELRLLDADLRLKDADERLKQDDLRLRARTAELEKEVELLEKMHEFDKKKMMLTEEEESFGNELDRHKTKKEILGILDDVKKEKKAEAKVIELQKQKLVDELSIEEIKAIYEEKKRKQGLFKKVSDKLKGKTDLQKAAETNK
ncbi:MAG: hypothetical protein ABIA76_02635 [Candidatus Diapherotrites archaeon]